MTTLTESMIFDPDALAVWPYEVIDGATVYPQAGYLKGSAITAVKISPRAPRGGSGYGPKVPSHRKVMLTDGRWRRIWVMIYGNSGSAYVQIDGKDVFLGIDAETAIEHLARDL